MRITVITAQYPPAEVNDSETLCKEVVEKLKRRGHTVSVLTGVKGSESLPRVAQVERVLSLAPDPESSSGAGDGAEHRLAALQRTAEENYEIIQDRVARSESDLLLCWNLRRVSPAPIYLARKRGLPFVYLVHDDHPKCFARDENTQPRPQLLRRIAEKAVFTMTAWDDFPTQCAVLSSNYLRSVLQSAGLPVQQARVLLPSLSLRFWRYRPAFRKTGGISFFLYVGPLQDGLGLEILVQVTALLLKKEQRNWQLSIMGSGDPAFISRFKADIRRTGTADHVCTIGPAEPERVAEALHDHHVLICPTGTDSVLDLAPLKAMACGCAVLAPSTGGFAEALNDRTTAFLYDPGSPDHLAEMLCRIIRSEQDRRLVTKAARSYITSRHSLDQYVTELEALFAAAVT